MLDFWIFYIKKSVMYFPISNDIDTLKCKISNFYDKYCDCQL